MATTIGRLNFLVGADASGVATGLAPAGAAIRAFSSSVTSTMTSLSAAMGGLTLVGAAGWGVKLAADAERAETAFSVLLGSAAEARSLLGDLKDFAVATPFELPQLQEASRVLLNFGVSGRDVMSTLQMLGDISGGNSEKLHLLAVAFGQMHSAGRLMGQDLLQMINAGFNPLQEISKRTGESMAELRKRMEAGGISVEEVTQAFRDATSEGGRFFGMTAKSSQDLHGRFSTLKDTIGMLLMEMAERLMPTMKALVEVGINVGQMLQGVDADTVKSTIGIIAMSAAFAGAISIAPRVITAITGIITTLRALATGQAIVQALAGPQGLITLTAGLAAAAGAGLLVNEMFSDVEDKAVSAADKVKKAGTDVKTTVASVKQEMATFGLDDKTQTRVDDFHGMNALRDHLSELKDEIRETKRHYDSLMDSVEDRRNSFVGAAERFTTSGFEAIHKGAAEGQIQAELTRLRTDLKTELKALGEEVKSVEQAIRDKQELKIKRGRI